MFRFFPKTCTACKKKITSNYVQAMVPVPGWSVDRKRDFCDEDCVNTYANAIGNVKKAQICVPCVLKK